jgi:hypothetical protein
MSPNLEGRIRQITAHAIASKTDAWRFKALFVHAPSQRPRKTESSYILLSRPLLALLVRWNCLALGRESAQRELLVENRHGPDRKHRGVRGQWNGGARCRAGDAGADSLLALVENALQMLSQGLRDFAKLNKATRLKVDVSSFQVLADRLAKLISNSNSLSS